MTEGNMLRIITWVPVVWFYMLSFLEILPTRDDSATPNLHPVFTLSAGSTLLQYGTRNYEDEGVRKGDGSAVSSIFMQEM